MTWYLGGYHDHHDDHHGYGHGHKHKHGHKHGHKHKHGKFYSEVQPLNGIMLLGEGPIILWRCHKSPVT